MLELTKIAICDLETLGIHEDSVILDFSAIIADLSQPLDVDAIRASAYHAKLSVESQLDAGRTTDPSTVEFWSKQPPAAQQVLIPSDNDMSLSTAVATQILPWLNTAVGLKLPVFQRGDRDMAWTLSLIRSAGAAANFPFWTIRETRTAIHALGGETASRGNIKVPNEYFDLSTLTKHSSIDDCIMDFIQLKYLIDIGTGRI